MFAHGLARQVLIESVTLQARKEIHAAIAEAVVRLYPERIDEMAERLARHYQEAGQDDQAVHYLLRAVDRLEDEGALESAVIELRRTIDFCRTATRSSGCRSSTCTIGWLRCASAIATWSKETSSWNARSRRPRARARTARSHASACGAAACWSVPRASKRPDAGSTRRSTWRAA